MRNLYLSSGMVQLKMIETYNRVGEKQDFLSTVMEMYKRGEYLYEKPVLPLDYMETSDFSDNDFIELLYRLPINLTRILNRDNIVLPDMVDTLPSGTDTFLHKYFNCMASNIHTHGYFEIGFVLRGPCKLKFEREEHTLYGGELFIIAAGTKHDLIIEKEKAIVIMISIRKGTFDNSFFNLLTQEDLLSNFFRTILYSKSSSKYLMFYTDNSKRIRNIYINLIIEHYNNDSYFNNCCISWINILFSTIMREYSNTIKFNNYNGSGTNFSEILKYMQSNYKFITLDILAENFHYSKPYLSELIKKNTGNNFTTLINSIKLSRGLKYMNDTTLPLAEISELIGYNSEDYFSRVFKKFYNESPQQYRKRLR